MTTHRQGHSLTFVQGHSDSTFSNIFSSETAGSIEAKFYMEPPWDVGNEKNFKRQDMHFCEETTFFRSSEIINVYKGIGISLF